MVAHRPLVRIGGRTRQLPADQSLNDFARVVTVAAASHIVTGIDLGVYLRFTATGAKTSALSTANATFATGNEFHFANRSASGDLTLVPTGITLNTPKGGTLVLEPGDTVTVKFVSATVADVFGSTKEAE